MTVKELREMLKGYDDNLQVCVPIGGSHADFISSSACFEVCVLNVGDAWPALDDIKTGKPFDKTTPGAIPILLLDAL